MKKIKLTSDSPGGWCKIAEINKELCSFEKEVFPIYSNKLNFELGVCFRCLGKKLGWKSKRRIVNDPNSWISLDLVIYEEDLRPCIENKYFPLNKVEQRIKMGLKLSTFLTETFKNYKYKLEGIKEYGTDFINDTNKWLVDNFWLLNNYGELELSRISDFSFEKTLDLLGPTKNKTFETNKFNKKTQLLTWDNIIGNKITLKYSFSEKWNLDEMKIEKINNI